MPRPHIPDKRCLNISVLHRDTGAIFDMVRYFDEQFTNANVLKQIWCEWCKGTGEESQQFLNTQTRSLSYGDVITIQEEGARASTNQYALIEEKGVHYFFTIPSAEALRRPFTGEFDLSELEPGSLF